MQVYKTSVLQTASRDGSAYLASDGKKYQHLQIAMSPDAALGASGRISFKPIGGDIVPQVSDNDVWFWSLQRPKDSVTLLRRHTAGITCVLFCG